MNKLTNKLDSLLPKYTRLPLLAVVCGTVLSFYATKPIVQRLSPCDFSLPIDAQLPLVTPFVLIYVLAFAQWIVGFILIARESKELCYGMLSGEIIAKLICMVLFLILPTTMPRWEITTKGPFSWLIKFIYAVDEPTNLFPSVHCLESWLCFRGSLKLNKVGRWYRPFSLIFTLLVFASTVLIKQHVVVDIVAGVLVCELGLLISKKTDAASIFRKIEAHRTQKDQSPGESL